MKIKLQLAGLLVMFFLFLAFALPRHFHHYDISTYMKWILLIHQNGLGAIYESNTNYHPIFLYCMWLYQWFHGAEEVWLHQYKHFIKLFPLFFEILGAASIFLMVKLDYKNLFLPFILLFNIGYMYNALLWGQTDGIYAAFVIISVAFALRENIPLSILAYLLAINTKMQAIVFFPLVGLLWLPYLKKDPLKVATGVVMGVFLQLIILWPFIQAGTLDGLWQVVTGATSRIPWVSVFAYNIWYLFVDEYHISDQGLFAMGLSYRAWGLMLFFISSFIAMWPLLVRTYLVFTQRIKMDGAFRQVVFLTGGLIAIGFFYFNTQMHERYAHPAIIFFFFYGILSRNYAPLILASLAEFLILEQNLRFLQLQNYKVILFNQQFIAILYFVTYLVALYDLYFEYGWFRPLRRQTEQPEEQLATD